MISFTRYFTAAIVLVAAFLLVSCGGGGGSSSESAPSVFITDIELRSSDLSYYDTDNDGVMDGVVGDIQFYYDVSSIVDEVKKTIELKDFRMVIEGCETDPDTSNSSFYEDLPNLEFKIDTEIDSPKDIITEPIEIVFDEDSSFPQCEQGTATIKATQLEVTTNLDDEDETRTETEDWIKIVTIDHIGTKLVSHVTVWLESEDEGEMQIDSGDKDTLFIDIYDESNNKIDADFIEKVTVKTDGKILFQGGSDDYTTSSKTYSSANSLAIPFYAAGDSGESEITITVETTSDEYQFEDAITIIATGVTPEPDSTAVVSRVDIWLDKDEETGIMTSTIVGGDKGVLYFEIYDANSSVMDGQNVLDITLDSDGKILFQDSYGEFTMASRTFTYTASGSIPIYATSVQGTSIVDITVETETDTYEYSSNISVYSGESSRYEAHYVGSSADETYSTFYQDTFIINSYDSENGITKVEESLLAGVVVESDISGTEGSISGTDNPIFNVNDSDIASQLYDIASGLDKLVVLPSEDRYQGTYLGGWEIDSLYEDGSLMLDELYQGSATDSLAFTIGRNEYFEECGQQVHTIVPEVTVSDSGQTMVTVPYSYNMIGRSYVLYVNRLTTTDGEEHKGTAYSRIFTGSDDFTAVLDPVTVDPEGDLKRLSGHVYLGSSNLLLRNLPFTLSITGDTVVSGTSHSMTLDCSGYFQTGWVQFKENNETGGSASFTIEMRASSVTNSTTVSNPDAVSQSAMP